MGEDTLRAGTHVLHRAWLARTSPIGTSTQASRGMSFGGGTDSQAGTRFPSGFVQFPSCSLRLSPVHFGYIRTFGGK
jgi:hypothetical protein